MEVKKFQSRYSNMAIGHSKVGEPIRLLLCINLNVIIWYMVSLDLIEKLLSETIYPQLEKGRPNWDKPHTISVVEKMKEILEHSPTLKVDKVVLLIAAYAHDWGYSGLFEDGKKLNLDDVMGAKENGKTWTNC